MTSGPDPAVDSRRASILVGIVLIALGGLFLLERAFDLDLARFGWPLFIVVPGLILLAAGVSARGAEGTGLAVAGGITTMVGLILAVQNATGLWATWAYAWALVGPGGTGLGLVAYGLLRGQPDTLRNGLRSLGAGIALFAAFGLFFEGVIGLSGEPFLVGSDVLPIVLIGIGAILVVWSFVRGRSPSRPA
jgi:hypothetical protein